MPRIQYNVSGVSLYEILFVVQLAEEPAKLFFYAIGRDGVVICPVHVVPGS